MHASSAGRLEHAITESIPVVISERHVHLAQDVIEQLFCDHYQLHEESRVSQPSQFAARESVTLVGPRGRIANVRVIGPPRAHNQVEISEADGELLGISAPLRETGDLKDTPGVSVEGPRARVRLAHGVIRALRHIHLHPLDAAGQGLRDGDRIDVCVDGTSSALFAAVLVRVSPVFRSELHIDADDARAAGLQAGALVALQMNSRQAG